MKKCEMCAEEILDEALKCKHCGHFQGAVVTMHKNEIKNEITYARITKVSSGSGRGCLSLIVPGLGQFANGEIGLGLTFLVLAIFVGVFTFGIGGIVVAIISGLMCQARYECSNCRTKVEENTIICPACRSSLRSSKVDNGNFMNNIESMLPSLNSGIKNANVGFYIKKALMLYLAVSLVGAAIMMFTMPDRYITLGLIPMFASGIYVALVTISIIPPKYTVTKIKHILIFIASAFALTIAMMMLDVLVRTMLK